MTSSSAGPTACGRAGFSNHDKSIIECAHQLADASGPYAEALSRATWIMGELLAIVECPACVEHPAGVERSAGVQAGSRLDSE
jgi:hypothetical protein